MPAYLIRGRVRVGVGVGVRVRLGLGPGLGLGLGLGLGFEVLLAGQVEHCDLEGGRLQHGGFGPRVELGLVESSSNE